MCEQLNAVGGPNDSTVATVNCGVVIGAKSTEAQKSDWVVDQVCSHSQMFERGSHLYLHFAIHKHIHECLFGQTISYFVVCRDAFELCFHSPWVGREELFLLGKILIKVKAAKMQHFITCQCHIVVQPQTTSVLVGDGVTRKVYYQWWYY